MIMYSWLQGPTLRVYWHRLKPRKVTIGVTSVHRVLGMSSPSVALHHLEKLRSLGLLGKDSTGEYHLAEQVEVGVLQNFVGVLGFLLPRHLFFSAMFTVMLVLYPILYPPDFSTHNIVAFIFGVFTVTIFWSETYRAWRLRPL